jgi:AraC family transcriptional regulator
MEQYGKQSRLCQSGTVMFHPAGEIHSNRFGCSLAHVLNIEINSPKLSSLNQYCARGNQSIDITGGMASWIGARLYQEFRGVDELSGIAIEGLVLQLLAEIFRGNGGTTSGKIPCWLEQAREIVHARFTDRLTLTDIAMNVGVHPVHLARQFHKHYSSTIGQFIRRLRIEYACREITHDNASLAEIALASGFSDQSNFSKTFKKLTGLTPHQFERTTREVKLRPKCLD